MFVQTDFYGSFMRPETGSRLPQPTRRKRRWRCNWATRIHADWGSRGAPARRARARRARRSLRSRRSRKTSVGSAEFPFPFWLGFEELMTAAFGRAAWLGEVGQPGQGAQSAFVALDRALAGGQRWRRCPGCACVTSWCERYAYGWTPQSAAFRSLSRVTRKQARGLTRMASTQPVCRGRRGRRRVHAAAWRSSDSGSRVST